MNVQAPNVTARHRSAAPLALLAATLAVALASALKEVADALANAGAARESAADVVQRSTSADKAEQLARARFDAGYAGYLDLLDAQRTAAAARLDVVRNRQAQLNASVDLFKALGGGWTTSPPGPPAR